MQRRTVLGGGTALALSGYLGAAGRLNAQEVDYDLMVIGGGNAGLPAALFAAMRGARVLIVDAGPVIGGTLLLSGGRMSAAGTKVQKQLGIEDHPDLHFNYVMRLSNGTADADIVRLVVDNAAPSFDWLTDNGMELADGVPTAVGMTHELQDRARYVWPKQNGLGILEVLERKLKPFIESGAVTVLSETQVTELIFAEGGRMAGVKAVHESGTALELKARSIALTSGGYSSNPEMFEELDGAPDYADISNPFSQGIGITLGISAGGYVRGGENHLPNFGGIPADDKIPTLALGSTVHQPKFRLPWEIWVNANGRRFIREDEPSIHKKELALIKQPHERFWMIFDDAILHSAPPVVRRWTREEIAEAFDEDYLAFKKADSIEELARAIGLDARELSRTVDRYNKGQAAGEDELGRHEMPVPIKNGPFYAIRSQSMSLLSFAGLAVDKELRVLREDGSSVPNLYVAGELLGAGNIMGQCYAGGMLVTTAFVLGRQLGKEIIPIST